MIHEYDISMKEHLILSARQRTHGPNHHIWNNNGSWWLHATVHLPDYTSKRLRINLRTRDVIAARRERDRIFAEMRQERSSARLSDPNTRARKHHETI